MLRSQGNCVKVGRTQDAIVVRDTKNRAAHALNVSPAAWRAFIGRPKR